MSGNRQEKRDSSAKEKKNNQNTPSTSERREGFFRALDLRQKLKEDYVSHYLGHRYVAIKKDMEELEEYLKKHKDDHGKVITKKKKKLQFNKHLFKYHFKIIEKQIEEEFDLTSPIEKVGIDRDPGEILSSKEQKIPGEEEIELYSAIQEQIENLPPRKSEEQKHENLCIEKMRSHYKQVANKLGSGRYDATNKVRKTLIAAFINNVLALYEKDKSFSLKKCWLLCEKEFREKHFENVKKAKVLSGESCFHRFISLGNPRRSPFRFTSKEALDEYMEEFVKYNRKYLFDDYTVCLQSKKFNDLAENISGEREPDYYAVKITVNK